VDRGHETRSVPGKPALGAQGPPARAICQPVPGASSKDHGTSHHCRRPAGWHLRRFAWMRGPWPDVRDGGNLPHMNSPRPSKKARSRGTVGGPAVRTNDAKTPHPSSTGLCPGYRRTALKRRVGARDSTSEMRQIGVCLPENCRGKVDVCSAREQVPRGRQAQSTRQSPFGPPVPQSGRRPMAREANESDRKQSISPPAAPSFFQRRAAKPGGRMCSKKKGGAVLFILFYFYYYYSILIFSYFIVIHIFYILFIYNLLY